MNWNEEGLWEAGYSGIILISLNIFLNKTALPILFGKLQHNYFPKKNQNSQIILLIHQKISQTVSPLTLQIDCHRSNAKHSLNCRNNYNSYYSEWIQGKFMMNSVKIFIQVLSPFNFHIPTIRSFIPLLVSFFEYNTSSLLSIMAN